MNLKTLRQFLIACLLLLFGMNQAQQYAANNIPEHLKKDAYAVVRNEHDEVDFLAYNRVKKKSKLAVTVLNESGMKYAFLPIYYNKSTKINQFKATIYDANGQVLRALKKKDLKDASGYDGFSLFIDTRLQYYDFSMNTYPFTIEYDYEVTYSNTINLPTWAPIDNYNVAVEKSSLTLNNHTSILIRKQELGFEFMKVEQNHSGNSWHYVVQNMAPINDEVLSPPLSEITARVYFSPNEFQLEGIKGKMENWKDFGKWYYENLIQDKYDLTEKDKQIAVNLVDGVEDPVEKVRILYEYMQSKTRYVNVSIGIGGWEPFSANYVSSKSYGDCKALSNYMISLLKAVGIEGFYTVVNANKSRKVHMKDDFTSLQGNHVIVNVPMEDETLWLECTSQQTAFNYLGNFTDNRYALSITPEGGEIISTANYPAEVNQEITRAKGELLGDGTLKINYEIESSGLQYDRMYAFDFMSQSDQMKGMRSFLDNLPHVKITDLNFDNDRKNAVFQSQITAESPQFAQKVGNELMLNVLTFERFRVGLKKDNHRKYPFEIRWGYTDETDFELKLPKGYQLSQALPPQIMDSEFGTYHLILTKIDEQTLRVQRKLMINDGVYPKEKFNDYVEFQRKISSLDNSKILIQRI